jgi:hypothetical protein
MHARGTLIALVAGPNDAIEETLWRKMTALTRELSGPCPTMMEQLLVGRVVTCWFQVHYLDLLVVQAHSSRQVEYLQRSQEGPSVATSPQSGALRPFVDCCCRRSRSTSAPNRSTLLRRRRALLERGRRPSEPARGSQPLRTELRNTAHEDRYADK